MTKKITNRNNKKYSGTMFSSINFEQGVAYTSDPLIVAYFERHKDKYEVEDVKEKTPEDEEKATKKKGGKHND